MVKNKQTNKPRMGYFLSWFHYTLDHFSLFMSSPPFLSTLFRFSLNFFDSPSSAFHKSLPSAHYRGMHPLSLRLLFPCSGEPTLLCLHFILIWTDDWFNRLLLGPLAFSLHSFQFSFYKTTREFSQNKSHPSFPCLQVLQRSPLSMKQTPWLGIKRFHDLAPASLLQTSLPACLSIHT